MVPAIQLTGVFGATAILGYALLSSYENRGDDLHFVTNNDQVVKVDGIGFGIAWGWNDKIHLVPDTVRRNIEEQDFKVFSSEGEPFTGNLSYAYRYKSDDDDYFNPELLRQYQNFIEQHADDRGHVDYNTYNEPFRNSFETTLLQVARAEFSNITSEEYRDKAADIRVTILSALEALIEENDFPIEIVSFDMNEIKVSQAAQNRISENILKARQGDTSSNTEDFDFITNFDAFFQQMKELDYSRSEAMEAYCLHLVDSASREGREMGTDCLRPEVKGFNLDSP